MKKAGKKILCVLLTLVLALPLNLLPMQAAAGEADEVLTLKPNVEDTAQENYFTYTAYAGKTWNRKESEAFIDLGTEDSKAEQCYYEIHFKGNGIKLYANKSTLHGMVKYTVDGKDEQTVDLYATSRTGAQLVYEKSGLTEGDHVLKAVTLNQKNSASSAKIVNQVAYAEITHQPYTGGDPDMGGTIADVNTQHTQDLYGTIKTQNTASAALKAWKNDKAISELVLFSKNCALENVTVTASALTNGTATIPAGNVTATFIKSTKAYNGSYLGYGSKDRAVPAATASNRSESSDILYQKGGSVDIPYNSLQPVWVEFAIPKGTAAGTYTGTLTANADGIAAPLTFTYTVEVQDAELPDVSELAKVFDVELWQYPYSSAEYYNVTPFSEEHLAIMRSSMEKYKEVGGHAITTTIVEEAWSGQTYSKNDVHYPSMVKWTKNSDGSFAYDYTDFDKWVTFCKSLGLGDKIVLYSIAPWHNSFTYWEGDTLKYEAFTPGNDRYNTVWTDFLTKLIAHLEEKGWFEESYIGIDERGFNAKAFDLIDSVKNSQGVSLKTAGAMDGFVDKKDLAMRVDDLNVGDSAAQAHAEDFAQLLADREEAGLRTTLYSCTEHRPGNFSLSAPMESYWSIVNAGKAGTAGFLRWAYDAWVEDPLNDTTHNAFEPGDCFLIYPAEKNAEDKTCRSSVRLERMAEGFRDVNKLLLIEKEVPALADEIDALYAGISTTASLGRTYLTATEKTQLEEETNAFKAGVADITSKYIAAKSGGLTNDITSLAIEEGASASMTSGSTMQLHTAFTPENVLNTRVNWSSSNPAAVTVSSTGKLTAVQAGTSVITAVSAQDSTKSAAITITVTGAAVEDAAKVSYYSFDSMDGNVIKDEWGSRNGTSQGATLSDGKSGKALTITEAGKSAVLNGTANVGDAWTVAYWVNGTASGGRSSVLMDSTKNYSFDTSISGAKGGVHVGTGSGDILTFNYTYPVNTWVHMTWTQDKTNGLSLYINGELKQTNNWTATNAFTCPIDVIGGTGFTGKIDELKIYNKVLTHAEISSIMQMEGLNIQETRKEMNIGDTWQIAVNLISSQADKTVTFTSADPSIASVDKNGMVTAKKRGTTEITVENKAGGYKATVQIIVTKVLKLYNTLKDYELPEQYLSDIEKHDLTHTRHYLGQPDMIMLDDEKTLITVYPVGHGRGPIVMQVSTDAGETWTEKTDAPQSWQTSYETPTIYKLNMTDGTRKLIVISGRPANFGAPSGGWDTSISTDNGQTWSEFKTYCEYLGDGSRNETVVAMASLIQLKNEDGEYIDKWMGVYHDGGTFVNYKTYLTFDENGNQQWSTPEPYLSEYRSIEQGHQICEVGLFRSPDGKRIVGLARSQSHNNPSTMFYSDDEGETWSEPVDLPGSLAGERHKAVYDPTDPTGQRMIITFREICYDLNKNDQMDGNSDWLAGDWIGWVGTYDQLMNLDDGQFRVLLCRDWAANAKSGDTGYTGIVVQSDGTFIMDTYGHWDKEVSESLIPYNVYNDLCYIKQAKFKLSDLDSMVLPDVKASIQNAINSAPTDASGYTRESWDALQEALKNAQAAVDGSSSTQLQCYAALEALKTAKLSLEEGTYEPAPEDPTEAKEQLEGVIAQAAEKKDASKYTEDSWKEFQIALANAQKVQQNASSTKTEIEAAMAELNNAMGALKLADSAKPDPSTGKPNIENPGQTVPLPTPDVTIEEGKIYDSGNYYYKVTSTDKKTAEVTGIKNKKITKITVYSSVKLGNDNYKITSIAASAFKNNKKVKSAVIRSNVESIGNNAFAGCTGLKTVSINSTKLKKIGNKAFFNCKKLKSIRIKSKVLTKAGKNAFKGISKKAVIKVPKAKYKKYVKVLAKKGQSKTVKIKK